MYPLAIAQTEVDLQFIIVRTKLDKKNGRKVNVSGSMETLEGQKLAEAQ
jgi:hypothetical protein